MTEYEAKIYSPHTMPYTAMVHRKIMENLTHAKIFRPDTTVHVMFYQPNKANRSKLRLSPKNLLLQITTFPVLHQRSYVRVRIMAQKNMLLMKHKSLVSHVVTNM